MRLDGKRVLITGGNSGIGLAVAKRVIDEGARVIITGRDGETLRSAVDTLGPEALGTIADVGDLASIDRMVEFAQREFGEIDGLFANAGIAIFGPIASVTEAQYDTLMQTNVKGVFFTLQKALPILAKGGAVVLNASVADVKGNPNGAIYAATKAAVRSFARTFTAGLADRGIRVNAVSPGPIETPIWSRTQGVPAEAVEATKNHVKSLNPMKRFGTAEEVAATVAFLLSADASYIAASEIYVDGGLTQL